MNDLANPSPIDWRERTFRKIIEAEKWLIWMGIIACIATGIFAFRTTYLLASEHGDNFSALVFSLVAGAAVVAANLGATRAINFIMPEMKGKALSGTLIFTSMLAVLIIFVAGGASAVALSASEARAAEFRYFVTETEVATAAAKKMVGDMEQVRPLLGAARSTLSTRLISEIKRGQTGSGSGPISVEIEARLALVTEADNSQAIYLSKAREGLAEVERLAADMRKISTEVGLTPAERKTKIENRLSKADKIVVGIREDRPLTALSTTATLLMKPVVIGGFSEDQTTATLQREAAATIEYNLQPIGNNLSTALAEIEETPARDVPRFRDLNVAHAVFMHSSELLLSILIGFATEIIPFLTLGLVIAARRGLGE